MKNKKALHTTVPLQRFPSKYVSDAIKSKPEFGKEIGQAIQYDWFQRGGSGSKFFSQWNTFHNRRLYARGQQSMAKAKNEISVNGDLSYLNLDWTPVPIIPKFVDIVVNGMCDRMYHVTAFGQDTASAEKRDNYKEVLEKDMVARPVLEKVEENFGVDAFNSNQEDLPQSDEELQLRMELDYKDDMELAAEAGINTVLLDNNIDNLKERLFYDQTVLGISIAKDEFLEGDTVKAVYCDPANMIYSYTEDPNFRDCIYWGEVKTVPTIELRRINPDLTDTDLDEISQLGQDWYRHNMSQQYYRNSVFSDQTSTILDFTYKTTKKVVHKIKGDKAIEKEDDWDPPQEMMEERGFERIEREDEVWYEGVMVCGTDIMLKWEVASHQVREKSSSQKAKAKFNACAPRMYKGNIDSLVERMIPFAGLIDITHLKLQQVIQRVVPDGVFIDADGINEVDLGNGAVYNPDEALKMYLQTGSVIGRSYTGDGEFNHARVPIQELNKNSGGSKISSLITSYNHYLNSIRDVTGLNEARDGSDPDPNSLVGLQKLAALNSNTATRHILFAVLDVVKDLAIGVNARISDALEFSEHREDFARKIGRYNVDLIHNMEGLHLHDFAIFLELAPDDEQRQLLEQNIQKGLDRNTLELEDAIDLREIRSVKQANQLLKVRKRRKRQRDMKEEAVKNQMQAQINMQSQQAAAQAAAQKIQMEVSGKMQLEEAKAGFAMEKMKNEAALKKELMLLESELLLKIRQQEVDNLKAREDNKETAKDKRVDKQSTQQSKLIEQRQKGLTPINFESSEDSLDGFDLAEFDPR